MSKFKYLSASQNIGMPNKLIILVFILPIIHLIVVYNLPKNLQNGIEYVLTALWLIVFFFLTINIFYSVFEEVTISYDIKKIEEEKSSSMVTCSKLPKYKEDCLKALKAARELITPEKKFAYVLKPKEVILACDQETSELFLLLVMSFFLSQYSFNYAKSFGITAYEIMAGFYILFFIKLLLWFFLGGGRELGQSSEMKVIGFIISSFLLFYWGKNTYVRSYGNEIIGSFFEKKKYMTQYYVYISSQGDETEVYKLPADVLVNMTEKGEDDEVFFLERMPFLPKEIFLKKIYWPNGGSLSFTWKPQELEMLKIKDCRDDSENKDWKVELRPEKVE